jgi:predicted RNA-binding protein with PIN domain
VAGPVVIVDGENVRRSRWPNLSQEELEERVRAWGEEQGVEPVVVFDGRPPVERGETADDWIAREAQKLDRYWLVTSDRGLRARAGERAERVIGGGAFLSELGV